MSDFWPHGAVGKAYGIFNEERGIDKRAAYVVDAQGIRYAKVYPQGTIPTSLGDARRVAQALRRAGGDDRAGRPSARDDCRLFCARGLPAGRILRHDRPMSSAGVNIMLKEKVPSSPVRPAASALPSPPRAGYPRREPHAQRFRRSGAGRGVARELAKDHGVRVE
ncbi:MAG: hypothetical protein KIT18_07860 [Burkholderiales bacterium]|nr:hypothetical protein [Burkholderiales bacterium]